MNRQLHRAFRLEHVLIALTISTALDAKPLSALGIVERGVPFGKAGPVTVV